MTDPITLLQESIDAAHRSVDRNAAMLFLATVSADGQPGVRTLLLRGIEGRSLLILFSRYHNKWRDLQANGRYEVLLWYPSIGHQYRLRGSIDLVKDRDLLVHWEGQPESIRRVDVSYGDEFIPGRPIANFAKFQRRVTGQPTEEVDGTPPPDHVVAAWLTANHVERLVESPDRLHERVQYTWDGVAWNHERVIP